MRHDGPLADNNCDPASYLMSPTLGSGKITWSTCSRQYLKQFLELLIFLYIKILIFSNLFVNVFSSYCI